MLNRKHVVARVDAQIRDAAKDKRLLGVIVVRAQRLREMELMYGYDAGERAAAAMQAVIIDALQRDDEVLHIGGCDFVVILPALRNRQHAALAAAKLVRVLGEPQLGVDGYAQLPVAIGIALYPDHAIDAEPLCRCADIASENALIGAERHAMYEAPQHVERFVHGDLRAAIASQQLHLFLQPILDLHANCVDRVEALARWTHPVLGDIPPDIFVRVAEQSGLIGELTRWSVNAALRHAAAAREAGVPLAMSINLSANALQQSGLFIQLRDAARFWDVPAHAVTFELTESGLMTDLASAEQLLRALRDDGFGVAIDDFGTGYSSMAYLKRLPVTELKIDKSFIIDMQQEARTEKLVGSMIDLSHHLGIQVVAEGVENEATLGQLREMGCEFAQGYHIGRPEPAAQQIAALRPQASAVE